MITIKDLVYNIKPVSIYCLINEKDKKVLFLYSQNTANSISTLNTTIRYNKRLQKDRNKIEVRFIETYDEKNDLYLRFKVNGLYEEYKQLGYTFYNAHKPLQWSLYITLERTSRNWGSNHYRAIVKLKTSANKRYNIKEYRNVSDAEQYIQNTSILDVLYEYTGKVGVQ